MKIVRRRGRRCHRRRRSRASNPLLSRHVSRPHRTYTLKSNTNLLLFVLKRKRSRKKFVRFFKRDIFRVFLNLLLLVMPPENLNTRYQHICDEGNAKDNSRSLSLSFSLSFFIRLRLSLKKRTRMATTFFSIKLRWYQQLVFNLVQRVF